MFGSKDKQARPTSNLDTWIGPRIVVEGRIMFSGGMRVDGVVRGVLIAQDDKESVLTLSDKGSIEGELTATYVEINGQFNGDIIASERITLGANARVTGNIYYKILEISAGAEVCGKIVRQESPLQEMVAVDNDSGKRAEAQLEAKLEPKEKSRLEAKRA